MTTIAALSLEPLSPTLCPPATGRELGAVRAQAALVRSLLDELEHLAPPEGTARFAGAFAAQAVEELAQLAHRMMEVAVSLSPDLVAELRLGIHGRSL